MSTENIVGYWTTEIPKVPGFYLCEYGEGPDKTYHILFIGDGNVTMNGRTVPIGDGKGFRKFSRFADIGAAKVIP